MPWILNKSLTCHQQSTPTPSHLLLHASRWEPHMRRSSVQLLCVSQRHGGWIPKNANLKSSDQRTDFHRSNVHCSCFLAQASLFFLLVSFSSGFLAAIRPWRPDSRSLLWTVDVEMCLLLELCEVFIWAAISEAGNSNERILYSRGNSGSSFPVAGLMRASCIIALDGFCDYTWSNFQSLQFSRLSDHVLK